MFAPCKTNYDKSRQRFKNWRHHLANKSPCVKAIVFPVVMDGCESSTIKKAECQRIDAFEVCCGKDSCDSLDSKEIKPVNPKGNEP